MNVWLVHNGEILGVLRWPTMADYPADQARFVIDEMVPSPTGRSYTSPTLRTVTARLSYVLNDPVRGQSAQTSDGTREEWLSLPDLAAV